MKINSHRHETTTLLIEGFNAKDIVMDIAQVAVSSGAVVGTGGAGGDPTNAMLDGVASLCPRRS